MNLRERTKRLLRMCGHALSSSVHDRLDTLEQIVETDAALLEASIHIVENLHALAGRTIVEADSAHSSPEAALTAFLYSHLPARTAIDAAHAAMEPARAAADALTNVNGSDLERTAALLRTGYDVYVFGPDRRDGKLVISRMNGSAPGGSGGLSIATEVPGGSMVGLPLANPLADPLVIFGEIGLITLGRDPLPVLRELGDCRACVVVVDLQTEFEELAPEMRSRGYHWHLVLYRTAGSPPSGNHDRPTMSYYANHPSMLPNSRGSVFFFRDYRIFAEAQAWCAATLPRTYFKPQA